MVISNITISVIFCMIISLILMIIYFSKERVKNEENKYYKIMLFTNFTSLILHLACENVAKNYEVLPYILGVGVLKLHLVVFLLFANLLLIYMIIISKSESFNIVKLIIISFILETLMIFILNIKCFSDIPNNIFYSYGNSVIFTYIITVVISVIIFVLIILNYKKNNIKKIIPLIIYIFFGVISALIQIEHRDIVISSCVETVLCLIMYFTIENPDLKMIEQLELAKNQADRANNAKTEFLSSMSHEIRTPLNAISGFSDCILDAKTLDEAKENAKDIVDASGTLLDIVNGILDISKIEAGKLEIVNTAYNAPSTFKELAKLITPKMKEKGLDFTYYIAPDLPNSLMGDSANLKKIVTNILSNACKYTKTGFVRYEVNCVNMNDYTRLIISVEDSGQGIKKENINKLFTRFQRLEEDKNTTIEGTGLGLAITKQLTEMMGGKVIVHSVYGTGSKFTVVLNQKIDNENNVSEHKYKTTLDLHDVRILVVDDNVLNIKVAKKLLERHNANNITTCSSGFECIKKIKESLDCDIILLDDMMPKKSGVETLKELKEINGFKIPTIALTANAITGMKEKYLSEGFDNYLAKPIEKEELIRVINETLGRVVTEQMPIVEDEEVTSEEINDESKENEIIPVEDDIENELGEKLDLSFEVDEDNLLKESSVHVDHFEDEDVLNEVNSISTIPLVGSDVSTDVIEKVDVNYLKDNGVDIDFALDLLGDMDMYNSTVHDFVDEVDDKWKRIVEYKNSSDMENYAIEVHSLKSDAKYLGLMKLAEVAYKHELKSKEKDIDFVNNHFSELEEEYDKSIDIIKKYAKDN